MLHVADMAFFECYEHFFCRYFRYFRWFEFSLCLKSQVIWSLTSKWLV